MSGGANTNYTTQTRGAGMPTSDAQFYQSLGVPQGTNFGMATNPNMPNLGGTPSTGAFTQGGAQQGMYGQPQQGLPMQGGMAAPQGGMAAPQGGMAAPQGGQPNVYQQAAGAYGQALQGPNIAQFANPFQQQVINNTLGDISTAQQMAQRQMGAQATQARAFGGSRHGVADALTNAGFTKQLADTSANLNMQGFNTALGAAQQQQQMQSQLAGQGFGFGQALGQQQWQQGQSGQAMMQALIDAAKAQYGGFTGAPTQALQLPMAALGAANMGQQTQTTGRKLGLFDYLTLGATAMGGL